VCQEAAEGKQGNDVVSTPIANTIGEYLQDLETTVAQLSDTWRPDDSRYRADVYRQTMMNLSYAYFVYFHADPEHPDWAPLWNPVYTDQPNPDDIYLYAPIRGDLTYRISGNRGTCALLTFTVQKGWPGLIDDMAAVSHAKDFDHRSLTIGEDGEIDLILSAERPAHYEGDWVQIARDVDALVVRYRSVDWINERDPQLSVECLDPVPLKPRMSAAEIARRIPEMAKFPSRYNRIFYRIQNSVKASVGVNVFVHHQYESGLSRQIYWPAVFELDEGEALLIETELPAVRPYWNIQLNDPYFNAIEYVYRLSSLNASTAKISSDGKLRVVIALQDPGTPNWLDPAGHKEGTVYGRWYECDRNPMPTIKRISLADLRAHLPVDTPVVTASERAEQLRERVRACQRRRRW
jgi:hypothetical protein